MIDLYPTPCTARLASIPSHPCLTCVDSATARPPTPKPAMTELTSTPTRLSSASRPAKIAMGLRGGGQ